MNRTKVEWALNPNGSPGYTWNPITGCLNGCEYCYARKLANGRLKSMYLANHNIATGSFQAPHGRPVEPFKDPFYPRFWPERWKELQPIGGAVCELVYPPKTEKGIFVCDMSDLFGIGIPHEWTEAVLHMIKKWPAHRFYLLTKQPQNLLKWSPFPDNCWVGVTATDHKSFEKALHYLFDIEAKVKYISLEPYLSPLETWCNSYIVCGLPCEWGHINWLIIGAQTNPYKPPKLEWVQEIVEAADHAGIPVFLKDNLNPIFAGNDCKLFTEYRDKLFTFKDFEPEGKTRWHLRQEMPSV